MKEIKEYYNNIYEIDNYFGYKEYIYNPYIKALISKIGLKEKSLVLDIPCGQGFFSYLFNKNGMKVYGVDISDSGIAMAKRKYGTCNINFFVHDALNIPYKEKFDCIFSRSCSLYNTKDFINKSEITNHLLKYLKAGGIFIFAYNTNLSKSIGTDKWVNHTVDDVIKHFDKVYSVTPKLFLVNKIDVFLLRKFCFNKFITLINNILIKVLKINGDILYIFRKQ